MGTITVFSLIIPVYKNEASISDLLEVIKKLSINLIDPLEVIFVIDGSPDKSFEILSEKLNHYTKSYKAKLICLSRNFGSFAAIKTGLAHASGKFIAVMAADLQEPIELIESFFKSLKTENIDITLGTRTTRNDPYLSKLLSSIYWKLYKKFIIKDMPKGGIDIFGCNCLVRDELIKLDESHSSLIGLLMWVGFRRKLIDYIRLPRQHGKSAWTFAKKLKYLNNSIFAFSNLPIRIITILGIFASIIAFILGIIVIYDRLFNHILVPGYAATLLTILFFTGINMFSLGLVGSYVWRTYENSKMRPTHIIRLTKEFN